MLKKFFKKLILLPLKVIYVLFDIYDNIICTIFPQLIGIGRQQIIDKFDSDKKIIEHEGVHFWLHTPNHVCNFRHSTFATKEPEMLEWLKEYGGGVFFDIGANIGIYSLYYTQIKQGNVYSFEPSVFNLRQLAKNINTNNMSKRITVISNPLTDSSGVASFQNISEDEGGALSAFGVDFGFDGNPINCDIKYNMLGFKLDELFEKNILTEIPSLIKIDVDGIEHLILKGALKILKSDNLRSVLIEVNEDFAEQSTQVKIIMESSGFKLKEKRHSEMMVGSELFGRTFNQVWVKY